jgi:hypothetical protein
MKKIAISCNSADIFDHAAQILCTDFAHHARRSRAIGRPPAAPLACRATTITTLNLSEWSQSRGS